MPPSSAYDESERNPRPLACELWHTQPPTVSGRKKDFQTLQVLPFLVCGRTGAGRFAAHMLTQITQNAADSIPNLTDAARCSSTKTPGRKTLRAFAVGTGLVFIVGELGYRQPQNAIFGLRCNEFCRPFVLRREEMSPIQPRDKKKEMAQLGDIADPELDYGNGARAPTRTLDPATSISKS